MKALACLGWEIRMGGGGEGSDEKISLGEGEW